MMISIEFTVVFLAFSIPLVCTPGPGNLILAMSGAQWGVRKTLPLIVGIDTAYILFSLMIGSGLGELFKQYPLAYTVLKYAGGTYLIYLSYRIWTQSPEQGRDLSSAMGFKDGVILTAFNPKAHLLMILMFSQFMKPHSQMLPQVVGLTLALAAVNIPNHFVWSCLGEWIARRLCGGKGDRKTHKIFSMMLLSVAAYIIVG